MKRTCFFLAGLLLLTVGLKAQNQVASKLKLMSQYDMQKLSELPSLVLPDEINRRIIPSVVDNSQLPYFRPLIAQVGLECGQASSIGVMFTYEMNAKRGVPGNVPENQYPTHFAYNFVNGGSDAGVSFWETFEILKHVGTPNVADYGSMSFGGPSRWISGYENYYNGMHNRIAGAYTIKTNTIEGLQTLKNWVFDHGNGSEMGGIASFYSQFDSPPTVLPPGTPEAGKHVILMWGSSPNHAMSIVGYNDSIRWDYNEDGQYTNDMDLNNDGQIDVCDWEIGGFKMANTYGSISGWGDDGFAYMMYKTVADQFGQGGIWNNITAVVDVKEDYHPMLTAKVNLTFPCRDKLKVMIGVATDTAATEPEFIYHYPIYDFQGGCLAMQGDSGDEHIEFGLDMNPLLTYLTPGQEAKYFLLIAQTVGLDGYDGVVNSFTLMDYNGLGVTEYVCEDTEVAIQNEEITMLSMKATINFDPVEIDDASIDAIELYEFYESQLTASGGTAPYTWELVHDYTRIDSVQVYPELSGDRLSIGNDGAYAEVSLPFDFPFFGETFDKLYPTSEGFIMFEETLLPWPYYIEGRTYFIQNKLISPCFAKPFYFDGTENNGLWFTSGPDSCVFTWKLSTSGVSGNSLVELCTTIFPDGTIRFNYGQHNAPSYIQKFGGVSSGDGMNFCLMNEIGSFTPETDLFTIFTPTNSADGFTLTSDGLLSGIIDEYVDNQSIKIRVKDDNNITGSRSFPLTIEGVEMNYTVSSGEDEIIEIGENFSLNLDLHNLYNEAVGEGTITFRSGDPNLIINDSTVALSVINAGEMLAIPNVFSVGVSNAVEDGHTAACALVYATDQHTWTRNFQLVLRAPILEVNSIGVVDGENGILEPGETAQLIINFQNTGGAKIVDLTASMFCDNPDLQIISGTDNTPVLIQDGIWLADFEVYFSATAEPLQILELQLVADAANNFHFEKVVPLVTSLILENFETGSFDLFDWETTGEAEWFISSDPVFEGEYAVRSGAIGDNGASLLSLSYDVAFADTISFYFRVSSEASYDFLKFKVNDVLLDQWSGSV